MLKRIVRLVLNNNKFGSQTTVEGVHKGDDNSCELIITLTDGHKMIDLGENPVAVMSGTKPDGTVISNPCEIVDGKIKYTLTKQDTAVSGNVLYQVTIADGNNIEESILASAKFTVAVMNNIYIPIYRLLNEEPTDWSDNYSSYYKLVGNAYKSIDDTICPKFEANTFYFLVNPNYDSEDSYNSYMSSIIKLENLIGRASDILLELDEMKYEISKSIPLEKLAQDVLDYIKANSGNSSGGGITAEQLATELKIYAKSTELLIKEDSTNKVTSFDNSFTDKDNSKYPTVVALLEYLATYYYDWNVTEEIFKSMTIDTNGNLTVEMPDGEIITVGTVSSGSSVAGITSEQLTATLANYAKSAELAKKEDVLNKVDAFDSNFADASNTLYPTVTAIKKYLSDYYYNYQETYSQDEIDELLDEIGDGKSAYQIAVGNGFEGSETEWLASLKGDTGEQGPKGDTGATGANGYSPTASVTQTDTGAVITITDKSGTATATIANGKDGADGKDGLKLTGKTVVCFGDSLFGMYRGSDSATAYLAKQTGATVYNVGFGGCRMSIHPTSGYAEFCMWALADAVVSGDWTAQDSAAESGSDYFPEQLELLKSIDFNNVDIALIHYGTNDFSVGKAIDSTSNPYNCDTICGALRYSIEKLLTAYPSLRIFISLPVYRFWTGDDGTITYADTKTNSSNVTLLDVNTAIASVAKEYNLPIIDGYHGMGVNKLNASTYLEDGTHHNVAGRERFGEYLGAVLIAQGAEMFTTGTSSGGTSGGTGGDTDEPTTYTNQIPISTDTDGYVYNTVGYKEGYRLSSSGAESAMDGMSVTGFIPCAYLDKVYLKNIGFNASDSTASNQRICFYDSSKTFLGLATASNVEASLLGTFDDDGNLVQFTVTNLSGVDMTDVAFFRLNGTSIDVSSIITVNEPIV